MDWFLAPTLVGIAIYGVYSIVALFVHRRERIMMVEKLSNNPQLNAVGKFNFDLTTSNKYLSLKGACLLVGLGLGFLLGIFLALKLEEYRIAHTDIREIILIASALVMGWLGLLTSFLLELKLDSRKEKK